MIILAYNLNDIAYLMEKNQEMQERIQRWDRKKGFLASKSFFFNTWYFRYLASQDKDIATYYGFVRDAYFSSEWHQQTKNFRSFSSYSKQMNWKLMVVTFPFLHSLGEDYAYHDVHKNLAGVWSSLGVPYLDLFFDFDQYVPRELVVNSYDAHPNEKAHRIAAESISKFISTNLR